MLVGIAYGQSTYHIRYDTVKIGKGTGGPGELVLESSTKDTTSGILVNIGGGKTQFKKVRAISATQFVVGSDTVTITGSGGGGSGTLTNLTATNGTGQTWTITNPTTTPNLSLALTSAAVGLGNVDNTSDANKPVSSATVTALALKANTSHTHAQGDVTNLVSDLSGKAATSHTHVISDVTSLQSTIDAKVADALTDGVTTIAPSQNAVFDVLSSQQYARPPTQRILQLLGSANLYYTLGKSQADITTSAALADAQTRYIAVNITEQTTLTGVSFWQSVTGDYTADAYNGIGLYSYSAGTMTLVASTTNDGNIFKGTVSTMQSKNFSSTYAAAPGLYFICFLYNAAPAAPTAPSIGAYVALTNNAVSSAGLTNSAKLTSLVTAQAALPATQAMSGTTASAIQLFGALY